MNTGNVVSSTLDPNHSGSADYDLGSVYPGRN